MNKLDMPSAFLMEHEGGELLKQFGLPVVQGKLADTKRQAIQIASEIGYPVVLKGMSRHIVHKTEAGVVKLNILNQTELEAAFDTIVSNAKAHSEEAELAGVLVQSMASKGIELIIGVKKDSILGHQLLLGLGGVFVEIVKDAAIKMMPVSDSEVEEMIGALKGSPLLHGYRGGERMNAGALKNIVTGLNRLVAAHPEIEEMDLNPVIFANNQAVICDVRILLEEGEQPSNAAEERSLEHMHRMINPRSVAVVGASTDRKKNGGRLFRYIVENGFAGELYPIHPSSEEVQGYKAYPSLSDVPGDIDLALIIVSAKYVPGVLKECIQKGIMNAVIYSSGFSEIGEEGARLQAEIISIAREGNLRLLGPNSIGIASPGKSIYTAFGAALETKVKLSGRIGFVSQSGAIGSALLSRAWELGAGFSRWISVGNEADLTLSDFIEVLAEDEATKVTAVFMEDIKNVKAFQRGTAKALTNGKPVLVYKTGRSAVGKRAVQSHTGSLAGDDDAYTAFFEKNGVMRVDQIEDLIDTARAFEIQPVPKGKRIAVVTASGGACSVIADLCEDFGIELPMLTETAERLKPLIPSFGSAVNPIDVTAEIIAKPEMFKQVLQTLAHEQEVDAVIVMLTTNADPGATIIAEAILDVFKQCGKPIVLGRLGADAIAPQAVKVYQAAGFPVYPTPERVVRVLHYLIKYREILDRSGNGRSSV